MAIRREGGLRQSARIERLIGGTEISEPDCSQWRLAGLCSAPVAGDKLQHFYNASLSVDITSCNYYINSNHSSNPSRDGVHPLSSVGGNRRGVSCRDGA